VNDIQELQRPIVERYTKEILSARSYSEALRLHREMNDRCAAVWLERLPIMRSM
jgi:hypothetical protein